MADMKKKVERNLDASLCAHPFSLKGEVAVITGGQGMLGGEYAGALARVGASVALFDLKQETSPAVAKLAREGLPVKCFTVDITKKAAVRLAMQEVVAALGTPTVLVNNAGLSAHPDAVKEESGPFETYPEEVWDAMLDSHLKGAFLVSQAFIEAYRKGKKTKGSIINVSSIYGLVSPPQALYEFRRKKDGAYFKPVGYSVAKSGMFGFTKWLAEYCGYEKLGLRVNTLVPGGVEAGQDAEFIRAYEKRTIVGRMAQRDDYNGAVVLLASSASGYMTGATLVVDGGWTAR